MKKFLPLILLALPTASFADITHTLQSVASVSTLGASATSERIAAAISVAGTNVAPKANTVAGQIGSLDLAGGSPPENTTTMTASTKMTAITCIFWGMGEMNTLR